MKVKLLMGMIVTAAFLCYADAARAFIFNHDRSLLWNATQSVWSDANSWDNVQGSDLGFPGSAVDDSNLAYALIESGTAAISPGDAPAGRVSRSYIGGTGVGGGVLNVSEDSRYGRFYTAWLPGETGTLNLSAGTMTMESSNVHLGNAGNSVATISGGTMNAIDMRFASESTSTSVFELSGGNLNVSSNLILAYLAGATSDFKVSSGSLTAGRLWMRTGTATLNVSGSGSSISVDRFLVGTSGHNMEIGLDAGGVTTVNVVGDQGGGSTYEGADLNDLAIVVNELPGFGGVAGSTYDLISSVTTLSEVGLTVTDTIPGLDFTWAIVPHGGNQVLRLTAVAADLPGDFNGNGVVDAADYTVWRDNLGALDESALNGNGTGSGGVDGADYTLWESSFGNVGTSDGLAVPEPCTVSLLSLAIGIGISLSSRKKQ